MRVPDRGRRRRPSVRHAVSRPGELDPDVQGPGLRVDTSAEVPKMFVDRDLFQKLIEELLLSQTKFDLIETVHVLRNNHVTHLNVFSDNTGVSKIRSYGTLAEDVSRSC